MKLSRVIGNTWVAEGMELILSDADKKRKTLAQQKGE